MFPIQRFKGTSSVEVVSLFAVIGALAVPVLAALQISAEGAATLGSAAWWLRFGFAEAFFVLLLAAAWRLRRRRA
jgi:hypothetical protein